MKLRTYGVALGSCVALACSASHEPLTRAQQAIDEDAAVVIRQLYGGGSNTGAPLSQDFVELFNRSSRPVSLLDWSIQYSSATGTGNLGATSAQRTELSEVVLQPGQSYLVQEAGAGTVGAALPMPDLIDATPINLSATGGKVALVRANSTLGCNGSTVPCLLEAAALIVDLVGYGSANYAEGVPASATDNTLALIRKNGGCLDDNSNAADFALGAPAPRNGAMPPQPCSAAGGGASGAAAGGASGDAAGGASGAAAGAGSAGTNSTDDSNEPGPLRIYDVQGRGHRSPFEGTVVTRVPGIVTELRSNGFYMASDKPDADPKTSEGLFVFTGASPSVIVGDSVLITGPVSEFRPGCSGCSASASAYANLTTTEIERPTAVTVLASGQTLPDRVVIGSGGRQPPTDVIDTDGAIDVESPAATFSPASDGIDFYESLEGMRVQLRDAVAVGPNNSFGELPVLVDFGVGGSTRTARGGIVIGPTDFNPERIILSAAAMPNTDVGDTFPGDTFAIVDYSFGNYKFLVTDPMPAPSHAGLERETLALPEREADELDIASLNLENLDPGDPPEKFGQLAQIVIQNLAAPDILTLEEVQDDNGPTDDGTVSARQTLDLFVQAVRAAGGPDYEYRTIDPLDGKDGGEPGGNIRIAFLFRTDRGLTFVDRNGADATTPNAVLGDVGSPELAYSPGRIDPANAAFNSSRKPLAGQFRFNDQSLFVVGNHFNSKGGDNPLFGRFQPPLLRSQPQRVQQASVVAEFVRSILTLDAQAQVVVLGDLNDFEFSLPVMTLEAVGMTALMRTLPPSERYSYVFEGNSQALDQLLVSDSLMAAVQGFDVVHVNAEFSTQASDHDPALVRLRIGSIRPPQCP